MSISGQWEKEKSALKAVQVAFDVGDDVNQLIRFEALTQGISPTDRVRQLLGLTVNARPMRPRLSISLSERDFTELAARFGVDASDRLKIRQMAAEKLIQHLGKVKRDEVMQD
ncbi:MAG: hypothetical protein QNL99_00350 [SAR86 cluster bacterium]|jgi:hypothetical protein|tara:strand:- start:2054 stop:2392 length:339 start_codon:yes stop_codon:yes gene_type:complete